VSPAAVRPLRAADREAWRALPDTVATATPLVTYDMAPAPRSSGTA
jgi:hypothetical protein